MGNFKAMWNLTLHWNLKFQVGLCCIKTYNHQFSRLAHIKIIEN